MLTAQLLLPSDFWFLFYLVSIVARRDFSLAFWKFHQTVRKRFEVERQF